MNILKRRKKPTLFVSLKVPETRLKDNDRWMKVPVETPQVYKKITPALRKIRKAAAYIKNWFKNQKILYLN